MPSPCCVPGCKSNYKTYLDAGEPAVSVFTFPKDENLKTQWLRNIPRKAWSPSKYSVVCAKHFVENDIIKEDDYRLPDGSRQKVPTKTRLKLNAVPSIFPNLPHYLSKTVPLPRKSPAERTKVMQDRSDQLNKDFENSDLIINFDDLTSNFKNKIIVNESWNINIVKDSKVFFIH